MGPLSQVGSVTRTSVDHPTELADRAFDGLGVDDLDVDGDADAVLDPGGDLGGGHGTAIRRGVGACLHDHRQLVPAVLSAQPELEMGESPAGSSTSFSVREGNTVPPRRTARTALGP